ncbi:MAG: hypothetical protein ABII10_00165, partial [Candidatus Paceibacterota bacterium]
SVDGARGILYTITGGSDMTMTEVSDASSIIAAAADPDANIIFGASIDEEMANKIKISVIATGFDDKLSYSQRQVFGAYGRDSMRKLGHSKKDQASPDDEDGRIDRAPDGYIQPQTKNQMTGATSKTIDDATNPFIQSAAFTDSSTEDQMENEKEETLPELATDDFDDEFEIPSFLRQRK